MLKDIVAVQPLPRYRLKLRFEDGLEGVVDVSELVPLTGVFALLREQKTFRRVRVDPELGTVVWPTGADLDPDVLYSVVAGRPLPALKKPRKTRRPAQSSLKATTKQPR
jgi:hypothetical protein